LGGFLEGFLGGFLLWLAAEAVPCSGAPSAFAIALIISGMSPVIARTASAIAIAITGGIRPGWATIF
jgi:hypothetical protein